MRTIIILKNNEYHTRGNDTEEGHLTTSRRDRDIWKGSDNLSEPCSTSLTLLGERVGKVFQTEEAACVKAQKQERTWETAV